MSFAVQFAGSTAAILLLAWLSAKLKLGGDLRIRDEAHARELAEHVACDFDPVAVAVDRAGMGALLRDSKGRHLVLRRHGAMFAGRVLEGVGDTRLDRNFLTIGTREKRFGTITLDLGPDAQSWASGLRHA